MMDEQDGQIRDIDPYQPIRSRRLSLSRLARRVLMRPPGQRPSAPFLGAFFALYHTLAGLGQTFRAIDDQLWPEHTRQEVNEPLYIIANPRSGTTYLHNLLSLDEERFASHKLYQTILPSVTVSKLGELAAQLDRRYAGGELSRLLERFDDAIMPFWDGIHSVGMRNTEEDEALFVFQKASIGLCLWLPAIEELRTAVLLDHWPDDERQQVVAYYRDCIRRHVFAQGGRRFLGKNVLASGRIGTLLEAFPSAGIVYLVRHPYEAIPSFVSMFSAPWVNHSPDIGESAPEHRQLAGIAIAMYRHAFAMCQELPPERVLPIRYQDLVADPVKTVERIYGHFGMEASPGYAAKLRSEVQVSKNYKSTHAYSLEGYGLTREEIHASLKDVFEAYGFEP